MCTVIRLVASRKLAVLLVYFCLISEILTPKRFVTASAKSSSENYVTMHFKWLTGDRLTEEKFYNTKNEEIYKTCGWI